MVWPVHDHRVPDHEGGSVGALPNHARRDLLGSAHAADRLFGDDFGASLGCASGEAAHHRSVDVARTDCIDANSLRGIVEGRRLGETYDAVLSGGVGGAALYADDSGTGGSVDDGASA